MKVNENGVVGRNENESCIKEMMESKDFKKNALQWKDLAREAFSEGGSSEVNIEKFLLKISQKIV